MELAEKLKLLPNMPGVYLMKDEDGNIIYVGKATSLKQRVRSYFQSSKHHSPKVISMVEKIRDLETIVVDSPLEALILECNLIKQHKPKYNVRLRDDKHYPYLKITLNEEFPRIMVVRSMKPDGAKYFGPYTSTTAMYDTLKLLESIFPLRLCKGQNVDTKSRPCLNAHIKKCAAPCAGEIGKVDYLAMVKQVILFLEGRQVEILRDLEKRMEIAAENLQFEEAARVRDQIRAVKQVVEKQKIVNDRFEDRDVVALAKQGNEAVVQVFFVRNGKVVGREHFRLTNAEDDHEGALLEVFLQQYYGNADYIPREIVVQHGVPECDLISQWLSEKRGGKVIIHVPIRGEKKRLVDLVAQNAQLVLFQQQSLKDKRNEEVSKALEQLRVELNLGQTPRRIECYDISNTQGTNSVGSMVVFVGGEPKTNLYRRFKIKTVEGPNDFASMQEIVRRRIIRGQEERKEIREGGLDPKDAKFADFPDLIIIDGGKGQLSAVTEILDEFGLNVAVFGLAKEFEHLFQPGNPEPIILARNTPALYLIQRIRDEAHRFAITYHRKLRSKEQIKSALDDIPLIGQARKEALLKAFGSVKKIAQASVEELATVQGMNMSAAESAYNGLRELREKSVKSKV